VSAWKRFRRPELFEPSGVRVIDETIYVICRERATGSNGCMHFNEGRIEGRISSKAFLER